MGSYGLLYSQDPMELTWLVQGNLSLIYSWGSEPEAQLGVESDHGE